MIQNFYVNLSELENLSEEFKRRDRMIGELKYRLKIAAGADSNERFAYYQRMYEKCDALSNAYHNLQSLSNDVIAKSKMISKQFTAQLDDNTENLRKIEAPSLYIK